MCFMIKIAFREINEESGQATKKDKVSWILFEKSFASLMPYKSFLKTTAKSSYGMT